MFLGAALDPPRREFTTLLHDLSFEVGEGDRLAILGLNGAGKSTLLRVLNGVYSPSSGHLSVSGNRQALLNMSLGFNGEATVRENIFLRGTAMGLKAERLRGEIESILDFAGLLEKSNHRLRTLSSGQRMRLGFAISTSVQHDIILMDEWVGAGDAEFMAKATERMQSRMRGSKIVVLASHSTGLLREICNRGLVLDQGRLLFVGDILPALTCYHEVVANLRAQTSHGEETAGYGGAIAYGCAERVSFDAGVLRLGGWLVDTEGGLPSGLAVEVDGVRSLATRIDRVPRTDVMRHLGLSTDNCGIDARFDFPEFASLIANGGRLSVLGGVRDAPDSPLRIAAGVFASLHAMKPSAS